MKLRPYQQRVVDAILLSIRTNGSPFVVLPTGAGKMVIIAAVAAQLGVNVLIVEHRIELIDQALDKLNEFGVRPGLVVSGRIDPNLITTGRVSTDHDCRIKIAMVQTVNRRDLGSWTPGIVIIDEAHLSAAKSYISLIERFGVQIIGFSATPVRLDGKGFDHIFTEMIIGPTIKMLTDAGFLVPVNYLEYDIADLSGVRTIGGEYDQEEVGRILDKFSEDIVDTWVEVCGEKPTVVFASDIRQSKNLCEWFRKAGYEAEHIDGTTPDSVRKSVVERFKSGRTRVLCNCGIVIEGFDAPLISCVLFATATMSVAKFLQCNGRGMRPHPASGKTDLTVMDFGCNSKTHGYPSDDRKWSLAPKQVNKRDRFRTEYIEDDAEEEVEKKKNVYVPGKHDYGVDGENKSPSHGQRSRKPFPGSRIPPRYLPKTWMDWWWQVEEYRIANRLPNSYSEELARTYLLNPRFRRS